MNNTLFLTCLLLEGFGLTANAQQMGEYFSEEQNLPTSDKSSPYGPKLKVKPTSK